MCFVSGSDLLTCQQMLGLPGNLITGADVRQGVYDCVRYLTTETTDEPLELNHLMSLHKTHSFSLTQFVVEIYDRLAETIQAAKALAVTLARWTSTSGKVQIAVMNLDLEDVHTIRAMGFIHRNGRQPYTWHASS